MVPPVSPHMATPAGANPIPNTHGSNLTTVATARTSDTSSPRGIGDGSMDIEGTMDHDEDDDDVESTKHLSWKQQLDMMRGKLARRNKILEVVRRAYYHDVIVVKEELRHARLQSVGSFVGGLAFPPSSSRSSVSNAPSVMTTTRAMALGSFHSAPQDDRLSSIPSIDLRDVLPLFAPAETVLKVHPCETCGGHLELIHGESREVHAARQEIARASKSEQQMKTVVYRLRSEAKEKEDLNDALQQRVKALVKENSYTLEQLQAARKMERDQKTVISNLRSKLQLAQTTQEDLEHLSAEYKDVKQQLIRSNHDRDIFSASNNHLKEELAEISKTLHQAKVDHAQLESDYGTTYYKLQEELKKTTQLREELASERALLKEKIKLSDELQQSLTALKDEFATSMMRAEQTKRQLEDQLADEEKAREEAQEQNLEFRKINNKLVRDVEQFQRDPLGLTGSSSVANKSVHSSAFPNAAFVGSDGDGPVEMKALIRRKIDDTQRQLEHALMREHDLMGLAMRQQDAALVAATQPKLRKKISRMPSTTVITRLVPPEVVNPVVSDAEPSVIGIVRQPSFGKDRIGDTSASGWQGGASARIVEGSEGDGISELDEKGFEMYHHDLHRLMIEIEDSNDKSQKQQKAISDLERKNQTLVDRLEEAKLSIETLTGSVAALKARLNQDNAGAAEHLEDMMREIDENKRDQQYEVEHGLILMHFVRTISNYAYELCQNQVLLVEFDLERPSIDSSYEESDSLLSPELLQRKRELRKKVLMDRAMKKFSQQCHQRAEMVAIELKKMADTVERLRLDLDEAENKIDSDQLVLRNLEAENSKLLLMVEVTKTNLGKSDKALKQASEELQEALARCIIQNDDLKLIKAENTALKTDTNRLTALLFEKTKAWEKEINTNDKTAQKVATLESEIHDLSTDRDALALKLQEIQDLVEWKLSTNKEVGIMVAPEVTDMEIQTDRWRPQGLILRQRNDPQRIPQRYLGKASVTIACGPELLQVDKPPNNILSPLVSSRTGSLNQSPRSITGPELPEPWAEGDEHKCETLEFELFPPAKAGGRQIKTSQASTRPRNLSRLFLSSDGVTQKYIAPTNEPSVRPSTTF